MNEMITKARKKAGMRQWQVAEVIGLREDTFSRMLRHELPIERQKEIVRAIEKAANRSERGASA